MNVYIRVIRKSSVIWCCRAKCAAEIPQMRLKIPYQRDLNVSSVKLCEHYLWQGFYLCLSLFLLYALCIYIIWVDLFCQAKWLFCERLRDTLYSWWTCRCWTKYTLIFVLGSFLDKTAFVYLFSVTTIAYRVCRNYANSICWRIILYCVL